MIARLLIATVLGSVLPAAVADASEREWQRPVAGPVARGFDYAERRPFAGGQHRGVDLRARPGATVRSACPGTVVFAGRPPGQGRAVSVRCGARRVSYLPLRGVRVRRGDRVGRGDRLARVAPGHHGALHVGVRREGDRFGYVDPLGLFGAASTATPPLIPRAGPPPRRAPPARSPRGRAPRVRAPVPARAPAPQPDLAPWPVWLGLALLLLGAAGGTTLARRRRRSAHPAAIPARRPA